MGLLSFSTVYAELQKYDPEAEGQIAPKFEIQLDLSFGYLIDGVQKQTGLTPDPDSYPTYTYGLGIGFFPVQGFGFQGAYFRGSTSATSSQASGSIGLYDYSMFKAGAAFRVVFRSWALYIAGGATIASLDLNSEFKSLIQTSANAQGLSVAFNSGSASGLGYYVSIGPKIFLNEHFFLGFAVEVFTLNTKYDNASQALDGVYLNVPFHAGVAF